MPRPYVVTQRRQLIAIASPGREEIIDGVAAIGPCTVPELAAFVGQTRHALYYHVRALESCGLLRRRLRAGNGRKTTAVYDLPGRPLSVRYDLASAPARRAVIALGRSRLRSAERGFERACRSGAATLEGPRRDLWVARWKGWLSGSDLETANRLLWRLVRLLRQKSASGNSPRKLHELTFALAPIIPRAAARSAAHLVGPDRSAGSRVGLTGRHMPDPAKRTARRTARKQTGASGDRIEVRTPNVAGYSFTVAAEPYHAMKAGLLRVLPARAPGLTQAEMWAQVAKQVPRTLFPDAGKVAWWAKCVQLDLEARGELVREPTRPLRWHRRK